MRSERLAAWLDRAQTALGAFSVRTKILGIILGLVVTMGLVVILEMRVLLTATLNAQLEARSESIGRDLAARATDLILINDMYGLHQVLRDTQANNSDIRYAFIVDARGQVLAHTFGVGLPDGLIAANLASPAAHHRTVVLETDEGAVWDTAVPVFGGRAGVARVGLSTLRLHQTVREATDQLILTTLVIMAASVSAAVLLTWLLTHPIQPLVAAARAVAQGDLDHRLPRGADDEIGQLTDAFNAMTVALAAAAAERAEREHWHDQYVSGVIAAQEDERKRIARELHDSTSQALTSLLIGLRVLGESGEPDEIRRHLAELRTVTAQTLDEVHTLAAQLRPSVLDDLGLAAAVERQVADCRRRHALAVDLVITGLDGERLAPVVETALYRIVQEGLTNVVRHAQATTASVLLECRDGVVRAIIEDDGQGFDPEQVRGAEGHLGLYSIRERAELLGGSLTVESGPGQGTSLFITIPVAASPVVAARTLVSG